MDGIYVLAATNRLDLIDVALLRPGRFDHKILVGLPTKEDRLEILRLQCQDICLEKEANLESLAAITENWSGAELRGLIVNAMFEASRGLAEKERPIITQKILKSSFKSALESRNNSRENNKIIKGSRVSLA
jgi:ATP-dependent 26S proteasome regulatory subunit